MRLADVFPEPSHEPIDWQQARRAILGALDVEAEYAALGVRYTAPGADQKGWRQCWAVGRDETVPSAGVQAASGLYHDFGSGETLGLFDAALKWQSARWGRWIDVIRYYAERARIDLGKLTTGRGGRIKEAAYYYHNADGVVAYVVFRYRLPNGAKTFTQHPPDGRGGWKVGPGCMDGVQPVPYRLPQLIASAAEGEYVWVVEGEKDADRLAEAGFVATTSHGGANATDRTWPGFKGQFTGRDVILLPDNDDPGWNHAFRVADLLIPIARSVRVVALPDLPKKGDVSDWLDTGHSPDELGKLALASPVLDAAGLETLRRQRAGESAPATTTTGQSGRAYEFPLIVRGSAVESKTVHWLWLHRIPFGFLTLLAGRTGVGKSYVTLDMAARMSMGGEVPDGTGECFAVGGSLIISEDSHEYILAPRLIAAGADLDRISFMTWEAMAQFALGDVQMLDDAYFAAGTPQLVVIDPPTNFLGAKDEHRNAEVRSVLMGVSIWAMKHDVAVVLITHCNKGVKKDMAALDRIIGSVAWASTSRIAHILAPNPDDREQGVFIPLKSNIGKMPKGLAYTIEDAGTNAKVRWIGPIDFDADDALSGEKKKPRGVVATEWLTERFRERREWASDELRRDAVEAGLSKNALWSPEVNALPIRKRQIIDATGDRRWVWQAEDGWPPVNPDQSNSTQDQSGDEGSVPF